MNFAQRLSDLMQNGKLTSYRLGKEAGISNRLIDYWKKGDKVPNAANLEKLASYFQVSVDYLLGTDRKEKLCIPLSSIRNFLGMSAKGMAQFLNRDLMTIYRWEQLSELPDDESLSKIADELHTTVDVLLGKDPHDSIIVGTDGNLAFESHSDPVIINLGENQKKIASVESQKEKLITTGSDELVSLFSQLTTENKQKVLELARLYTEHQEKQ